MAEQKIVASAQYGSGLVVRARENARAMLQGTLRALGFTTVAVNFEPSPPGRHGRTPQEARC